MCKIYGQSVFGNLSIKAQVEKVDDQKKIEKQKTSLEWGITT